MRIASVALAFALWLSADGASAVSPDWGGVAGEKEIVITVQQEDGNPRDVTIWLVVVDEQGYIRTRNTSWHDDIERVPDVSLRISGNDYAVRVSRVEEELLIDKVHTAYTAKYGTGPQILLGMLRPFLGSYNVYRVDNR